MADPTAARAEMLDRIRSALERSGRGRASPPPQRDGNPALDPRTPTALLARFTERLESVGGRLHRAADGSAAARALATIIHECGARSVATSDSPLVRRLAACLPADVSCFDGWSDRERLFTADIGLSSAQAAIAETGTLVLESSAERHRLVSLVPPVHVAVLRIGAIAPDLGAALAALDRGQGQARAVTLITGPSRTADIELELVVGVHGPRALHVVVIEEQSA